MAQNKETMTIFYVRLVNATLTSIIIQFFFVITILPLLQVNSLNPFSWMFSAFKEIFSIGLLYKILPFSVLSIVEAYNHRRQFKVLPPECLTRFSIFLNMFSSPNVTIILTYALCGLFTEILLFLTIDTSVTKPCDRYEGTCLVESILFLGLGGIWMGIFSSFTAFKTGPLILIFPPFYLGKLEQICLTAVCEIKSSIESVLDYCLFYIICGSHIRVSIIITFGLYLEDVPLDSILEMVISRIWIYAWFHTCIFYTIVGTMRRIFDIYLSEPHFFPIESISKLTLTDALYEKNTYNSFVAAQDLKTIAYYDKTRRLQIYCLSYPGHYPNNWNNLCKACLGILNEYILDLDVYYNKAKGVKTEYTELTSTDVLHENSHQLSIRNLSQPSYVIQSNSVTMMELLKKDILKYMQTLVKKPGLNYFFGEVFNSQPRTLLMKSQQAMAICEGLVFIAAASLNENKQGLVEKDLPLIMGILYQLKNCLDNISKLSSAHRGQRPDDIFPYKLKNSLASVVSRCIFKLKISFPEHFNHRHWKLDYEKEFL